METTALIATHRREIEAEITRLRKDILRLENDLRELDIAEKVLGRISGATVSPKQETVEEAARRIVADMPHAPKPEGIPTMPDMIAASLKDARKRGLAGLEPKGMADFISAKWWPNVPSEAVGPIAWRMWKRGELTKNEGLYALPRETEAELKLDRNGMLE